jgi:ribulose-5-phosphate 4-epimerase/fuculose-1-phosphate aldolase
MNEVIDQLVEVGRSAVARGLVLASGGNLSARLPGGTEFAVTGADVGMAYRRALNLEEAAVVTYRMLLLGDTTTTFPAGAPLHSG